MKYKKCVHHMKCTHFLCTYLAFISVVHGKNDKIKYIKMCNIDKKNENKEKNIDKYNKSKYNVVKTSVLGHAKRRTK